MATLADVTRIKERLDAAKTEAAKAQGRYESAMAVLVSEYGCNTVEEAEVKLEELRAEEATAKRKFERALSKFNEHYPDE